MTNGNISLIAIGLLYFFSAQSLALASEKQAAKETLSSNKKSKLNVCGTNPYFKGDEDLQKSTFYSLYRPEDLKRENLVATMEVKDGNGILERIKAMTLAEAELLWGLSKDSQGTRGERVGIFDPGWRFFELVGTAYQSTKPQLDRRPKFFYVYAKLKNGQISEYAVDGPGIRCLEPKQI